MDRKEIQDKINRNIRLIANKVFYNAGNFKYTNAYNKLAGRVALDWDMRVDEPLYNERKSTNKYISMFDVLSDHELKLVEKSSENLLELYKNIITA